MGAAGAIARLVTTKQCEQYSVFISEYLAKPDLFELREGVLFPPLAEMGKKGKQGESS